ncbi:diguanylate cyclase [Hydrocarboniphaga sp.]|uniref:sensor domain-containing protein n=1 Tax=Hydrocarboniphaga sp. TaxID=2033016 RepID=UPI002606DAD6|nr:diguanylate cyclase [Hydrocarboniphaga sp.]
MTTSVLLAVLGIWQIAASYQLAIAMKSDRAVDRIASVLDQAYATGDPGELQRATSGLITDGDLGLTYLAVTSPQGRVLAVDGRYESWHVSWLPPWCARAMRRLAYRWTGRFQQASLRAPGSGFGEIHFMITPSVGSAVHEAAVQRLWIGGMLALALAVFAGWSARLSLRRVLPPSTAWMQRLDPDYRPQHPLSANDIEERVIENVHLRAGSLFDEVARGVVIVDRDSGIRHLNTTAEKLTGWSLADVRGRLVYSVFHPVDERHSPLLTPVEICMRDNRASPATEMRLRGRDGTQYPVEVMAMPLRKPNGSIDGAIMLFHDISEREGRAEQLRRQARLSQGVIDHLVEGVLTTDPAGVIRFANARALRMFGYAREDLDGVTVTKLMPVPFLNSSSVQLTDYIASERSAGLPKVVGWRRDATTFPVELVVQTMTIDHSQGLLMIVRDITERLRSENLAQRLGRLLDAATEEVYIFDAASLFFVEVNRGARRNLGYHPSEMTKMTPLSISIDLDTETFLNYLARLRSGEAEHLSYRCKHRRADGSTYPVEVRLNFSREEEPPVFMAIAVDITERELAEQRLRFLAHHDVLTGLPNRATLQDRLSQAMLASRRSNRQVGVLFMDVDRFKGFNDTYGHEVGDAVLKQVASRLSALLRASDTVARFGGDEFVVVASGLRAEGDAIALAKKIQRAFDAPLELPEQHLQVSLSIGIAICPVDESDADNLLHHADLAMYEAKHAGLGQFRVHQVDLSPDRRRRIELERGIQAALALQQFQLQLSPAIDAGSGALRTLVAMFWWQHPEFGRVETAEAMASARRAGLQSELELWRLSGVGALLESGRDRLPLSSVVVPISAALLRHPDFAAQIAQLVQRHQLQPGRLIIAADAESLREARASAQEMLHRFYAAGLRLALHDRAGALIAAMSRGGLPPIDLILLDAQEHDGNIANMPHIETVKRALQLARDSELPVVATGVDSAETAAWLAQETGVVLSGSAIQEPLDETTYAPWLASRRCEPI